MANVHGEGGIAMGSRDTRKIAAVVVTWNRKDMLRWCLDCLLEQQGAECDVVVIDNGSTDGTSEMVAVDYAVPRVHYLNTGDNLGGAGGFMCGIEAAVAMGYDRIWVMDDDCFPHPTALAELLKADEGLGDTWGFLCSAIYWTDGTVCTFNRPKKDVFRHVSARDYERELVPAKMTSFVSVMFRTEAVRQVGLPIAEYFIWTDDYEYTGRISKRFPSYVVPSSKATHAMKANARPSLATEDASGIGRFYYLSRNDVHCYRQHGAMGHAYLAAKATYTAADILLHARSSRGERLNQLVRGTVDGLAFRPSVRQLDSSGHTAKRPQGKQAVKSLLSTVFGRELDSLSLKRIQQASVISFDVFDTLVIRDCSTPAVVFDIVERRYNASHPAARVTGFRDARIAAERRAREIVASGEPTVLDIYALLDARFSQAAANLLGLELHTELRICHANPEAKALYDALLAMGKRIVIASDMYLGSDGVGKILAKCGYDGYERLYVSSDFGMTKRSGHLFRRIAQDMNVACEDILHVGDNVLSDYLVPRRLGLHSFLYRRRQLQQHLFSSRYGYRGDSLANDVLGAVIANRIDAFGEDVRDWMGYAVLGPLLYGYTTWLHEIWEDEGRPGILFLSREGSILMQAWKRLFGEGGPARYVNVSRLALCRAMAGRAENYDQLFDVFSCLTNGCKTLGDYFSILGADPESIPFRSFGLTSESPFGSSDKEAVFRLAKQHCGAFFDAQYTLLSAYLQERTRFGDALGSMESLLICDIGWAGTMQALLRQALPSKKTIGAYLAVSDFQGGAGETLKRHELDRRGYWCNIDRWNSDGRILRFTQSAIETLFLNSEGSTVSYTYTADGIAPVKEEGEYLAETEHSAARLHEAALDFIDDCRSGNLLSLIGTPACETALLPYINTVVRPTSKALEFYSHFLFVDGVRRASFLPSRSLPYYLAHPAEAIRELELNNSKVLWLKGLLRLPFPYYQFLCFLTSRVGLKSTHAKSIELRQGGVRRRAL